MSRERYDKGTQFVELRTSGRLFPSWINLNFKKYQLEEILRLPAEDPCKQTSSTGEIKSQLTKYQEFIGKYLDFKSPYTSILLYHGLNC